MFGSVTEAVTCKIDTHGKHEVLGRWVTQPKRHRDGLD